MRLQVGLLVAAIAAATVLCALPAPWYSIRVVGPNFEDAMVLGVPAEDQEIRELEGEWSLWKYELANSSFAPAVPPPPPPGEVNPYNDPLTVTFLTEADVKQPNAATLEVYSSTSALFVSGMAAVAAASFGAYNVARRGKWRAFTGATYVLGAVLLFAAPAYFSAELPDAMREDAEGGDEASFGAAYEPYIEPETPIVGYYVDFSGGYNNDDPFASEQFSYGSGVGWALAGLSAGLCVLAGALLYGAPQWGSVKAPIRPREVYKYIAVPVVTGAPHVPRYPRRGGSYGHNATSPGLAPGMRRTGIAETPQPVDRYAR